MAGRVKTMMLFANGNIAAFDENDKQITELQHKTAIELWAEFATQLGYDIEGCQCRTQLPGGAGPQVILSLDTGNWKLETGKVLTAAICHATAASSSLT